MVYNVGVLISGSGSNLKAIINSGINVKFVVSNKYDAGGLSIAKKANIRAYSWNSLSQLESEVYKLILKYNTDLLILAGFMRLLSSNFIRSVPNQSIINIYPSLLPAFKGANAIEQVLKYKVKYTGVTIHYVDEGMDSGLIIDQKTVKIDESETISSLQKRLQKIEHKLYPSTIKRILDSRK